MFRTIALIVCLASFFASCRSARSSVTPSDVSPPNGTEIANDSLLLSLLYSLPKQFDTIRAQPDKYRLQIIYTQIDRDAQNKPQFTHRFFNHKPSLYFYPASTVKLPLAALALEKINEWKTDSLTAATTMVTENAGPRLTAVYNDPSAADGRPTVAHYIKKILLVSDNDAANRLYELIGQEEVNQRLHSMGYSTAQILHRLGIGLSDAENRVANEIKFFTDSGRLLYTVPQRNSALSYQSRNTKLGKAYLNGDKRIESPFDFSTKNRLLLTDLHSMVQSIMFPDQVAKNQRFRLTENDYFLLRRYMALWPRESDYPYYDSSITDGYVKFLLMGGGGANTRPGLRIFNKVGDAYGFLTDAAYVVDFDKGIEFMLSATIYCNSDETFNDDRYDYESLGFPFLKALGEAVYNHEVGRPRHNKPVLESLQTIFTRK